MRLYYAQNREDLFIKAFFPDVTNGFYVDVGANDPVLDSVTKIFYDEGWRGINVEPISRHIRALKSQRPEDINLQIGLSSKPGKLAFREYPEGDGLSTFDKDMKTYYKSEQHEQPTEKYKEYEVEVKTLQQVVEDNRLEHIHFIKVDVEGYEHEVVKGYDWAKVRPELICIEANHINRDWRPILNRHKYEEVFFDGINNYYLAKESLYRRKYFDYPQTVFAGNPIYYPAYQEIKWLVEEPYKQKLGEQLQVIQDRESAINFLQDRQRDVRFLSKQLVREVQVRLNRRAQGAPQARERVVYQASARLDDLPGGKDELLAYVHETDKSSIGRTRLSATDRLKPYAWKVAARSFSAGARLAAGLARRIR